MSFAMFTNTSQIYDLVYANKDYAGEAAEVDELIQARRPGARTLLDVACGTGGHLVHLSSRYAASGVDLDGAMLEQAARRLPGIDMIAADMRDFHIAQSFDAVICLFSSIGYMPTTSDLDRAIANMARHLAPRGVLIVDEWVRPDAWRGEVATHLETASQGGRRVARATLSRRDGNKTTLEMHHLVTSEDSIDYLVDRHELTLFETDEYLGAFREAGLDAEIAEGPVAGRDRYVAVAP